MGFPYPRSGCGYSRRFILEQLEDRIMLDAAPAALPQEQVDHSQDAATSAGDSADHLAADNAYPQSNSGSLDEIYQAALTQVIMATAQDNAGGAPASDCVRVVALSSDIHGAEALAGATQSNVVTIVYDPAAQSPADLLKLIGDALDGRRASSIAFATHELGEGQFQLTEGLSVNAVTLETNPELQDFWIGVGADLAEHGRIDLLACGLASTEEGALLISRLEALTGAQVAASTNATGNPVNGGDWILETHNLDLVPLYFIDDRLERFEGTMAVEWHTIIPADGLPGDQFGYGVSIDGNTIVAGGMEQNVSGPERDRGVAYVFQFNGTDWVEVQKIVPNYADLVDYAVSTAVQGDTAVVGDLYTTYNFPPDYAYRPGAAHVFDSVAGTWSETKMLWGYDPTNPQPISSQLESFEQFGRSVAINGDTIAVGCLSDGFINVGNTEWEGPGSVYVFSRNAGGPDNWGFVQKIQATEPQTLGDYFGYSIAMDADTMIISAKFDDHPDVPFPRNGAGAAYVFEWDAGTGMWTQAQKFTGHDIVYGDQFGQSAAMYGDWAVVTADYKDVNGVTDAGAAYVFRVDAGTGQYVETQELIASDGAAGDKFGRYCAMSQDYIIVSANKADTSAGADTGAVYVYKYNPGAGEWGVKDPITGCCVENMKLVPADAVAKDYFGTTVALFDHPTLGNVLVSGSPHYGDSSQAGKVYVITLDEPPPPPPPPAPDTGPDTDGGNTYEDHPLVVEGPTGLGAPTVHATDIGEVHTPPWLIPPEDLSYRGSAGERATEHAGEEPLPSAEAGAAHSPHGTPAEEPIGLYGFHEQLSAGKVLVFNFDDFHFTDLATDLVVFPSSAEHAATGLYDHARAIKAGKALLFNMDEITFMDVLTSGADLS
jgi:hypothetical protein